MNVLIIARFFAILWYIIFKRNRSIITIHDNRNDEPVFNSERVFEISTEEETKLSAPLPGGAAADAGPFYHGTKASLKPGDLLQPGFSSNYGERKKANYVYLTATMDAAIWGAELAVGDGPGRIYQVEPTGDFEDDPNLTDKKFPGNPTRSYRTRYPLRVVGEISDWEGHAPEVLQQMQDRLDELKRLGIEAIND